jgi:hypothetical protein
MCAAAPQQLEAIVQAVGNLCHPQELVLAAAN